MSQTHFLFHIVFGTKDRMPLISQTWEGELYKYLGGIIRNHSGEAIEINGMPDHIHLLARLGLKTPFSDLMRELKSSSSRWIRADHQPKFAWQRRYGAFTVSESVSDTVRRYIRNQKEHHQKRDFESEYIALLKNHKIAFEERYLWE
jgi:REP element-mobilizing transposase RayT